jgi:sugar phosphate isomerase/epimerase
MPLAAFPKCFLDDLCVRRTMTVEQWIDLAATLPVDGLEFYWGFTLDLSRQELERLRRYAADKGLPIPMLCFSPDFTQPDAQARQKEIEKQKRAIEATATLGGTFCRTLSGQRRPEVNVEDGLRWAADCINECVPYAAQHGITLILENHYKDGVWDYPEFAQRKNDFLRLLELIPESPNFGVNYDPSNTLIAGEDPIEMLDAVLPRVVSMHASDRYFEGGTAEDLRRIDADPQRGYAGTLKHGIIGRGLNDYDAIFSRLKNAGFAGWISIEDGDDPTVGMEHLRLSAEFLREKMAQHGLN